MCILAAFCTYFFQQFEDLQPKYDWYRIVLGGHRIIFGFPNEYQPQILATRVLVSIWLFGGMIFNINFLAVILKLMDTTMYKHQIGSIQEIVDNSFKLRGDAFVLHHLKAQNEVQSQKMLCTKTNVLFNLIAFFL